MENHTFSLPEKFQSVTREVIDLIDRNKIEKHITRYTPRKSTIREQVLLDPEFERFWSAISQKTIYSVHYDTNDLIRRTAASIKKMDKIVPLKITTEYVDVSVEAGGLKPLLVKTPDHEYIQRTHVPDILYYVQSRVELTRHTIFEILKTSGLLEGLSKIPSNSWILR